MDQLLMNYRSENRSKNSSKVAVTLLVAVVTSITLYAMVPIADGLSREFGAWLEGLSVNELIPVSIIGCTVWLLSMYLLVRDRLSKGDQ